MPKKFCAKFGDASTFGRGAINDSSSGSSWRNKDRKHCKIVVKNAYSERTTVEEDLKFGTPVDVDGGYLRAKFQ